MSDGMDELVVVVPLGTGQVGISYLTGKGGDDGKHYIGFLLLDNSGEIGRDAIKEESSENIILIDLDNLESALVLKKVVDHAISQMRSQD